MENSNTLPISAIPDDFGAQVARKQPAAIALLNQLYNAMFKQSIQQGCGNCYQKAYYRIQKRLYLQNQNNPNMLTNRKYILKPGRSLQTTFGGDVITNHNLTDKAAEKLLQAYPALLQHFEKHPLQTETASVDAEPTLPPVTADEQPVTTTNAVQATSSVAAKQSKGSPKAR